MQQERITSKAMVGGYCSGHCWYYVLGGSVLPPKHILRQVKSRGYKGYLRGEIELASNKPEPVRSQQLRTLRIAATERLASDISRYRQAARQLSTYRKQQCSDDPIPVSADDVHVAISLKHNHIYNELAHLALIDEHLMQQPDLFG